MEFQEDQKEITIIDPMDANEARECINKISSSAAEIGRLLLDLKTREGWKALGYKTWTSCLQEEFPQSRKRLYELMKAAPIIENLSHLGYKLNSKQANALARYPEEMRPEIVRMAALRHNGLLTESRIQRVAETLLQAEHTGYVDVGHGSITVPFDANIGSEHNALSLALDLEDQEAAKRKWTYKNTGRTILSFKAIPELYQRLIEVLDATELGELLTLLNSKVRPEYS